MLLNFSELISIFYCSVSYIDPFFTFKTCSCN